MRNLPKPSRDECKDHLVKSIYLYKYKVQLGHKLTDADVASVLSLYDLYDERSGVANDELKAENLAKSLRVTIKNAYRKTYEDGELYSIRTALFKKVQLCPICGIEPVTELDHHLPESYFSALAIYVRNLVPLCGPCNKKKRAFFGDPNENTVSFIHAYFDELPDAQFIKAEVDIGDNGLVVHFGVDFDCGISKEQGDRILGQIEALELNSRYPKEINTLLTGHAVTMHSMFRVGGRDALKGWLRATASHARHAYYRNYWTSVLLYSLASHDAFIDGGFNKVFPVPKNILDDFLGH